MRTSVGIGPKAILSMTTTWTAAGRLPDAASAEGREQEEAIMAAPPS
jgi:hypothetical protein